MLPKRIFCSLLFIFLSIIPVAVAVPKLGIQHDYVSAGSRLITSYSSIIKFEDVTVPGDSSKLSDAQFVNLAKVAYDEMITIWEGAQLRRRECPGALIAMESEGFIYFASSMRKGAGNEVELELLDENIPNSVGNFMAACIEEFGGSHTYGGACAEPNVLRLYGEVKGLTSDNPPQYRRPPSSDQSPRFAVWARASGSHPSNRKGAYIDPCKATLPGYGCENLVEEFRLKPVGSHDPDPRGEDDWKFLRPPNPRACIENMTGL